MEKKFELSERLEITGAGKTTAIWQLVDQLVARGDKLIIHDVRSDLTQKLNIAPLEQRSRRWLIGKDITSEGGSHD